MQMIKIICLVMLVGCGFHSQILCQPLIKPDSTTFSLQQCIEIAIENNTTIRDRNLQTQAADINKKQSLANFFPNLNGSAQQGVNFGRSIDPYSNSYVNQQVSYGNYFLGSSITLFHGLQLQNEIRQNVLLFEANKMQLQQAKDELTLLVLLAYLQVLSQEELLSLAQAQLEVTRNQVDRLNILNEKGAIAPFNLYDLKGQLAGDETNILNITDALHQSKLALAQLMNIPYHSNMEIEKMDVGVPSIVNRDTADIIYKSALQHLAMVKAADLNLQSAWKQLKAVRGNYYPVLSLNGSMFTNYSSTAQKAIPGSTLDLPNGDYVVIDGDQQAVISPQQQFNFEQLGYNDQFRNNVSTSVSVGLTIPIFNSFQARNRVALAKINLMQAENNAQDIKIRLQQAVEKNYQDMISAYHRQQQSLEQVSAYSESFREAQVRYNTGLITSVDYLIAKNNMDRANINATITRYEFVFRNKILDFYEGKPLW